MLSNSEIQPETGPRKLRICLSLKRTQNPVAEAVVTSEDPEAILDLFAHFPMPLGMDLTFFHIESDVKSRPVV